MTVAKRLAVVELGGFVGGIVDILAGTRVLIVGLRRLAFEQTGVGQSHLVGRKNAGSLSDLALRDCRKIYELQQTGRLNGLKRDGLFFDARQLDNDAVSALALDNSLGHAQTIHAAFHIVDSLIDGVGIGFDA